MRILYISNITDNKHSGVCVCIPQIIKEQTRINWTLWINLNSEKSEEWAACANVFFSKNDLSKEKTAKILNNDYGIDLIVVEGVYAFGFSSFLKRLLSIGIPYIVVPHSQLTYEGQKKKKIKKLCGNILYYNQVIKKAAAVQYLSEGEKRSSSRIFKKAGYVVPNGVDEKENIKERFNSDKIVCSYIGRLDIYQKGIDLLMEAVSVMHAEIKKSHFELHIYGPSMSASKDTIEKQIAQYHLENCVFMHGPVYDREKAEVLLNSDCFILTSRFEGHPMSVIEALSYGVPCIVSSGTYMADSVEKYGAGWGCEGSVNAIAQVLDRVIRERSTLGEKSRNAVILSKTYSWKSISLANSQVYGKILEGQTETENLQP